jgi:glycosyltransferase involved in cell wall biosynthesis
MKISIAFGARGHAYSYALYLQRRSMLGTLYSSCPVPLIDPAVRPNLRSFPWLHTSLAVMSRLKMGWIAQRAALPANDFFDRWVASQMKPSDIFMAMSGLGLYARRSARDMGSLCVCDRGSTHIRYQDELLAEEFDRCGLPYTPISKELVLKEEKEYEESDLVVAQSSYAYQSFLTRGFPAGRLAWISPGVDLEMFSPAPRQDEVFRVLYLGQLGCRKGTRYLLEAMALLNDPKIELVLAGTILPEAQPLLASFAGKFRYAGRPGGKTELRDLYRQASVFALPTIEDGFGLVLNEAMACGLPIIATTNSGGPDLIEDGRQGFIVPIRSAEAFAERIAFLRDHPARLREMSNEALERSRQYSWDAYGDKVVGLYRRALEARTEAITA